MKQGFSRRDFIAAGVASALALRGGRSPRAAEAKSPVAAGAIKKSLVFGMVRDGGSIEEKLAIAKEAGFHGVQPSTLAGADQVAEMKTAAKKIGIEVESLICGKHWSHPLSDPDPKKVEESMENIRLTMKQTKELGGDMVLLVPAVVNPQVMYRDAWTRSQARIKELAPLAEELKITIAIENVWNKFLLSPLEFKRYTEEIASPYVKVWLDVGNMHLFGYPQDWVRTIGRELIARVHIKDFDQKKMQFVPLREGTIDWPEVTKALHEIGYSGYFTAEVDGGNLEQLKEVSRRMDLIIAGAAKEKSS